jgi:RNA polymerase sigma-70 factor (ECF subfamily)
MHEANRKLGRDRRAGVRNVTGSTLEHTMAATQRQDRTATVIGSSPRSDAVPEGRARFEAEALVHLDAMYSFALKLSRSRDDAEDLVSDTILRAFERWEQYRLGTNIRAWLFTILYHAFVSRKRRIDAREVQATDETDGWGAFEPVGEPNPEARFYETFLDAEITAAIDHLPDEYRAAVVLSDIHELRYAEIAHILGVPEGTVKSRLFRGRRILQKKLVGYAMDMGYIKSVPEAA